MNGINISNENTIARKFIKILIDTCHTNWYFPSALICFDVCAPHTKWIYVIHELKSYFSIFDFDFFFFRFVFFFLFVWLFVVGKFHRQWIHFHSALPPIVLSSLRTYAVVVANEKLFEILVHCKRFIFVYLFIEINNMKPPTYIHMCWKIVTLSSGMSIVCALYDRKFENFQHFIKMERNL